MSEDITSIVNYEFRPEELAGINAVLNEVVATPDEFWFSTKENYHYNNQKKELYNTQIILHVSGPKVAKIRMSPQYKFLVPKIFNDRLVSRSDVEYFEKNINVVLKTYHRFLEVFEDRCCVNVVEATDGKFHYVSKTGIEELRKQCSLLTLTIKEKDKPWVADIIDLMYKNKLAELKHQPLGGI